ASVTQEANITPEGKPPGSRNSRRGSNNRRRSRNGNHGEKRVATEGSEPAATGQSGSQSADIASPQPSASVTHLPVSHKSTATQDTVNNAAPPKATGTEVSTPKSYAQDFAERVERAAISTPVSSMVIDNKPVFTPPPSDSSATNTVEPAKNHFNE
ncbi:MAG: hypothetical protein HOP02_12575, partial [Methylococcaceae bacterium]|nr:hypothetical protein [Methylococcaceae bacterium]